MLQPRSSSAKVQWLFSLGSLALLLFVASFIFLAPKKTARPADILVFSKPRAVQTFAFKAPAFTEKNLSQHWTFLLFGFTHCTDLCPATLRELNAALATLHAQHPELQVVFVSIDPKGDSEAALKHYAASFNPHFIGLRGTRQQVEKLKQQFGVFSEQEAGSARINHSGSLFLINPQGQWLAVFPFGLSSQQICSHFKTLTESADHV